MQTNTKRSFAHVTTAEGSQAYPHMKPIQALRRSVLSCLLWESEFYESGQEIGKRIETLAAQVTPQELAALAIEARSTHNLRHVPLILLKALAKHGGKIVGDTIAETIQRADELSEFVSVYWSPEKQKLSKQVKLGLARAFRKFNEYNLAKYDRAKAVRLRDVLFMVHAKPKDEAQAAVWKRLVDNELSAPDTWEVSLSAGKDKKETFERLIREGQLGYLAVLRNLRNMTQAGVDSDLIRGAILARKGAQRVLPFRYVAAARACPQMEPALDQALSEAIADLPQFSGKTAVLVDVSPSMDAALSGKSDLSRMDAGCALASMIPGDVRMFSFSNLVVEVPPRRGMAGVDALKRSQPHNGTRLFDAIEAVNREVKYDRLIVITDEQDTGGVVQSCPDPKGIGYMINVASAKNGVGYGKWTHLDGFSEGVLRWIHAVENDAQAIG
jgi:60 kDa SS-A/Ro ribonucleoprotein